jgi:signal-transduction protein with cAMP-binding, CBS, and nucleotidyltransferase domain
MTIESFQAGDIIIKQHEAGTKFYFIMKGFAEVMIENEDYEYYNSKAVQHNFGDHKNTERKDKYRIKEGPVTEIPIVTESPSNIRCKITVV